MPSWSDGFWSSITNTTKNSVQIAAICSESECMLQRFRDIDKQKLNKKSNSSTLITTKVSTGVLHPKTRGSYPQLRLYYYYDYFLTQVWDWNRRSAKNPGQSQTPAFVLKPVKRNDEKK